MSAGLAQSHYHKFELENGMSLVIEHHPVARSVSIGVWVKVGSLYEAPSLNGISHFVEHMVFKETERRNALQLSSELELVGGDLNAFTDREYTCFHSTLLNEDFEKAADVLSDLVIRPTFPKEQVDRERQIIIQELLMGEDTPEEWILNLLFENIWKGSALGMPVVGSKKTVSKISRRDLLKFFESHYRPENMLISVAGGVDPLKVKEVCERHFRFPARQGSLPLRKGAQAKFQSKRVSRVMDSDQLHLILGYGTPGFEDDLRYAYVLLAYHLAGGMSSRLFQEIREKAALAYSVECDLIPYFDTGAFTFYVSMSPRSLSKCVKILRREIQRLIDQPLSAEELALAKGQLRGTVIMASEYMENRQEAIGRNELLLGRYLKVEDVIATLDSITSEKIQLLAQRTFRSENEAAVILSRQKHKASDITILE